MEGIYMIWILIVDAAIEIIPEKIRNHPAITSHARRRGKDPSQLLLNTNFHHSAMGSLRNKNKRGRPDIVHLCLLNALNTPLAKQITALKTCIHLRDSKMILEIAPETRIPRSLNRFEGLMVQALTGGFSGGGKDGNLLIKVHDTTLRDFLAHFEDSRVHALSKHGSPDSLVELLERDARQACTPEVDLVFLVGGYQKGPLPKSLLKIISKSNLHSLSTMGLDAWTVVARLTCMIEWYASKRKQTAPNR
ncbi:hypothetical protein GF325_10505 [Candidatus Bathyarchaeota archaeon]|nr:hypothetical protein [Candidatus Bathyarchaeota archaeon]